MPEQLLGNEHDNYIPHIFSIAINGSNAAEFTEHPSIPEVKEIRFGSCWENCINISKKLWRNMELLVYNRVFSGIKRIL